MSVDTSHVRPTSTLSPWQQVLFQQIADREIRNAATRAELDATAAEPTEDQLRERLNTLNRWAEALPVQASKRFSDWIREQRAATLRQLGDLAAGGAK